MNLLGLLNIEVTLLRFLGQCALVKSKKGNRFLFKWSLFIFQSTFMTVFLIAKFLVRQKCYKRIDKESDYPISISYINNRENLHSITSDTDVVVTRSVLMLYNVFESYIWFLVTYIRYFKKQKFAKIYNQFAEIDRDIHWLESRTKYVKEFAKIFFIRLAIFVTVDLIHIFDEFFLQSEKNSMMSKITIIFIRFAWKMVFSQQVTAYELINIQIKCLGDIARQAKSVERVEKVHRILMKLIKVKGLVDKTFNNQFMANIFGCFLVLEILLILFTLSLQNGDQPYFHGNNVFLLERNLFNVCAWIYYNFYIIFAVKISFGTLLIKFQESTDCFQPKIGFYSLMKYGMRKNRAICARTFVSAAEIKTISKVSGKFIQKFYFSTNYLLFQIIGLLISVLVIILQFRQIADLRQFRSQFNNQTVPYCN